jgi:hypothetical protein
MKVNMTQVADNNNDISVDDKLDKLETFIARRFDEISMEIEATSQLMEMAEEDAGKRFTDMLGMLNAISFTGDGSTPANSGAELEAVVKETEKAANTIMDSADEIQKILDDHDDLFTSDMHLAPITEAIHTNVHNIIMACGFQDLISQRVTTALENIRSIEERLSSTLSKFGIDTTAAKEKMIDNQNDDLTATETSSQGDIDALFD